MVEIQELNMMARAKHAFERAKAKKSDILTDVAAKSLNVAINRIIKFWEWTPSQVKLLKITQIMNELEGSAGRRVFETTDKDNLKVKVAKTISGLNRAKFNEGGAKEYVDRIKAILEQ